MAVYYNILQTGKGTLGNTYLRRTRTASGKEVNVLATKNFNPKNPKTLPQMAQRARFATAVKFYKRATRNFFRFAYEDKKANESDFNAFMRHNVNAAIPMVKAQVDNETYPAIGQRWKLSQGSLMPFDISSVATKLDTGANAKNLDIVIFHRYAASEKVPHEQPGGLSIGQISQNLMALGYSEGQIFTLVVVTSPLKAGSFQLLTPEAMQSLPNSVPRWNIAQFVIDPKDQRSSADCNHVGLNYLPDLQFTKVVGLSEEPGEQPVCMFVNLGTVNNEIKAATAIVSENVKSSKKLLATTSYLYGNGAYDNIVNDLNTKQYYNAMLVSWGADFNLAILQGSIAGDTIATTPVISGVNGALPPVNGGQITGGTDVTLELTGSYFDSEAALTENSFTLDGCALKSFANTGTNAATLVVTTEKDYPEYSVSYGNVLLWKATSEKA